ncbi:MAG: septum formation family protein [Acidimicrobiia bacterium]
MIRAGTALAVAFVLVGSACTAQSTDTTTTNPPPAPQVTTTTTVPPVIDPGQPLEAPETTDPVITAESALGQVSGYTTTSEATLFENDAVQAIQFWLPTELVAGTSTEFLTSPDDDLVATVSVIPAMSLRGDPGLVPALASLGAGGPSVEVSPGVYETETDGGLHIFLWSTGDGFLVASSLSDDAAQEYLALREEERLPLESWDSGTCLYFDPDHGLPWAPFTHDVVVPCNGAHNAEVLHAKQDAVSGSTYDEDAISYQRNYECDEAYEDTIGAQRDHRPTMITYMPDSDEWDRGDRYLACVVELNTNDGPELTAGPIADQPLLGWNPEVGDCFLSSLAPDPVECSIAHGSEFIGEVSVGVDDWPEDSADVFSDACEPLVDALPAGPAPIEVFAIGLYPYAFENGERRVRCHAFAVVDDVFVEVVGSFTGPWRPLSGDAIPA